VLAGPTTQYRLIVFLPALAIDSEAQVLLDNCVTS
jgi:hypothetical protein